MNVNWLNILERAMWTFVEGFLGGLTFSMEMDKTMLLAALMAGLSALKTLVLEIAGSKTGS